MDAVPDDNRPDRSRPASDTPTGALLGGELADLLADAIAGLAERDRLVLDLADRQGLATDEVAAALAMSPGSAYKLLTRARVTARKSIGALLVARTGRDNCAELNTLLGNWNGLMTPLLRKRVARHIEDCSLCQEQERRVASPAVLLGAGTAFAMPIPIGLRSNILDTAYEAQTRSMVVPPPDPWAGGWPPKSPNLSAGTGFGTASRRGGPGSGTGRTRSGGRSPALAVAAVVAVLLLIGAFVAVGRPSVSPEAVRGPLPLSSSSQKVSVSSSGRSSSSGFATRPTTATSSGIAPAVSSIPSSGSTATTQKSPSTSPRTTASKSAAPITSPGSDRPSGRPSTAPEPVTTQPSKSTSSEPSAPPTSRSVVTTRPSIPSRTTTRPTTPITTSKIDTAPRITGMSVVCQYSKSSGQTVPVLSWSTVNTQVVDVSVDNPGVVGSYGSGYPPNGQLELPPNGCDPSQGTQVYTLYAINNGGPTAQRTINWEPPALTTPAAVRPSPGTTTSINTSTTTPPANDVNTSPPPVR